VAKAKQIAKLNCQDAAAKVIRQILQTRMKEMCALRNRALDWSDPEGVHDMRVASRRLRSAISDFKPYLRKSSIPTNRLKAIAKSLGTVRDEDVVLAALDELRSRAGENLGPGIEAIAAEHRLQQRHARGVLEHAIRESAIADLSDDFRTRLRTATKIPEGPGDGDSATKVLIFSQAGAEVIGDRLKQLSRAGESVYRPLKAKQLHKLRILAKRLRYAIELFAPCWGNAFKKSAAEIALFQTSLGELHDCDVWIADLGARLKGEGSKESTDPNPWRNNEAVVWLLQHFVSERTRHYSDSLSRWHAWQTEGFLDRLRGMLAANSNTIRASTDDSRPRNQVTGETPPPELIDA
jgi:CHAD domain-containing protein